MKIFSFVLLLCMQCMSASSQKRPVDFSAINSWPRIENEKISCDGRYVLYNVSSKKEGTTLFIQTSSGQWSVKIKNASDGVFTEDNTRVVFKTLSDSLGIVELQTGYIHLIDKVKSFLLPSSGNGKWLVYQLLDPQKSLVLFDLFTKATKIYHQISSIMISADGKCLLLHQGVPYNNEKGDSVTCLDLNNGHTHFIWRGIDAINWVSDNTGSQIAFIQKRTVDDEKRNELWYYRDGMDSAKLLVSSLTSGMPQAQVGEGRVSFSGDGDNLFFHISTFTKSNDQDSSEKPAHCIVWSYQDKELKTSSLNRIKEMEAVVNLKSSKVEAIQIETKEEDNSYSWVTGGYNNNKVILVANLIGPIWDYNWRASARPDLYLVSTLTGARTLLKSNCVTGWGTLGFSPAGNFVYWFDILYGQWFTYNLRTGVTRNVTAAVPFSTENDESESPGFHTTFGMAGWIEGDAGLLLYDKFDIWQVDPNGINPPKNITLGYGRKHHIILRHLDIHADKFNTTFNTSDTLLLYTLDTVSKMNGFARIDLNGNKLINLSQEPKRIYGIPTLTFDAADPPRSFGLKAKNTNAYIFKPTRDTVYPNLMFTNDFIHFERLTNLEPQRQYNWYTSELVHWKQADGILNDGILFKPEDFDPRKKYPLIVYIYEKLSDALNVFHTPALSRGDIEILWFASRDYLVFVPDIHYVIGHPGQSAYNSVLSAVHYLTRFPWVDSKKLGLNGHSFGGYETNYIVTRTNSFAAACSANGVSDMISESGQLSNKSGYQSFFESGQGRMGTTLWQRPDLYMKESPIFAANKVTSPLLILHSPLDKAVYFEQAIEWFTSLRRLGKKAWMLQYSNEGHNLENEENELDYTIRLSQFFDHFLKGAPTPGWMSGN